jgi:hypothetical protein
VPSLSGRPRLQAATASGRCPQTGPGLGVTTTPGPRATARPRPQVTATPGPRAAAGPRLQIMAGPRLRVTAGPRPQVTAGPRLQVTSRFRLRVTSRSRLRVPAMWGNGLPSAVAGHKCQTLRWPAGDRPLPAAPPRPGRLARHPGEGKRAAHDSQQHSQHEPAEIRGNERREGGKHGENRIEDPLRRIEPQQQRTEDEHDRHHIAGQSLSAQVHHDGDRRPFGQQDLDAAEERDQAAPERPGAPPPAETQAGPPEPAAARRAGRPVRVSRLVRASVRRHDLGVIGRIRGSGAWPGLIAGRPGRSPGRELIPGRPGRTRRRELIQGGPGRTRRRGVTGGHPSHIPGRGLTSGHSSHIRGRGLTGLGRLLGSSRRVLRCGIVLGMGGVVASSHYR